MNSTIEQVLNAALALSDDERAELVEALLTSFQPEDRPPFDESWRETIQRRSAELQSGQVAPVPWTEVKNPHHAEWFSSTRFHRPSLRRLRDER